MCDLDIGEVYVVVGKEGNEFLEVLFCRVVVTTVGPNGLKDALMGD